MTPVDLIIRTVQAGDTFCVTHFYREQSAVAQSRQRSLKILFSSRLQRTEKYWRTGGRKVLVKYLFSEDQLDAIVERATLTWLELKERRVGQGS